MEVRRMTATFRTRLAAVAIALVAAFGFTAASAAPAQAYPWSSQVNVAGGAPRCDMNSVAILVQVFANTGEVRAGYPNRIGNWGARFYNIPSGGTGAHALVTCRNIFGYTWQYWSGWFTIYRPAVGDQINVRV
jgi:hypothetical protein